jgi:hypothetical protein
LDLPDVFLQKLSSKERRCIIEDTTFLPLGVVFKMLISFADLGGAHQIQGATPNTIRGHAWNPKTTHFCLL